MIKINSEVIAFLCYCPLLLRFMRRNSYVLHTCGKYYYHNNNNYYYYLPLVSTAVMMNF